MSDTVVLDASLTPPCFVFLEGVKMDETRVCGKSRETKAWKMCVSIHSSGGPSLQSKQVLSTSFHYMVPYIHPWCPNGPLCRLSRKGTLGESPPISPIPLATPDSRLRGGRGQAEREESCLPSATQESSMAARLMTPSLKVTKELLCTRARLWGLIELSCS